MNKPSLPEWREGEFSILEFDSYLGGDDKRRVRGYIYNQFGIHQTGKYGFSVTHIPTGCQVAFGNSLAKAKDIAEALVRVDIDWTQTHVDYYRELPKAARDEIDRARG